MFAVRATVVAAVTAACALVACGGASGPSFVRYKCKNEKCDVTFVNPGEYELRSRSSTIGSTPFPLDDEPEGILLEVDDIEDDSAEVTVNGQRAKLEVGKPSTLNKRPVEIVSIDDNTVKLRLERY